MMIPTANRLFPILGALVVIIAVFVGLRAKDSTLVVEPDGNAVMQAVPQAPDADADSPVETINTLQATVSDIDSKFGVLQTENELLRDERSELQALLEDIKRGIRRQDDERGQESQTLSRITNRIDVLAGQLAVMQDGTTRHSGDIPIGLGLDGEGAGLPNSGIVWVEPLDQALITKDQSRSGLFSNGALSGLQPVRAAGSVAQSLRKPVPDPRYTVPRNATLIGSRAMTGLIGRIPVKGTVQDPFPFKVLVGPDNLAANGITIPGVFGMVWSGKARGDWTLSCVTGDLYSVTFVFADGTIRTLSSDDTGSGDEQPIGWMSDAQGIPCISGERITNAASFLAQRAGLLALESAAAASAAAETSTVVSGSTGSVTSAVDGSTGKYVLGQTVVGGTQEINQWLRERQDQSFDAVFVKPGAQLAIHVDKELHIDYDPQGRRVHHDSNLNAINHSRLD